MFNQLILIALLFECGLGKKFETIICFDTKCAVTESESAIVRYVDCEPSLQRVTFCSATIEYCVTNPMTGKGLCKKYPTDPPPTEPQSRLTAEQQLALGIALPLIFLLFLLLLIIFCCYVKNIACFKKRKSKLNRRRFVPSFIEVDAVISNKAVKTTAPRPTWVSNFVNFYELELEDLSPVSDSNVSSRSSSFKSSIKNHYAI